MLINPPKGNNYIKNNVEYIVFTMFEYAEIKSKGGS